MNDSRKKQYDEFMSTGGYSKKMIYAYGVCLLVAVPLGWFIFPNKSLWGATVCLLLSLPPLFLYRLGQCNDKAFGGANTPEYARNESAMLILLIIGISLLALSIYIAWPFIKSTLLIVFIVLVVSWLINSLAKYHVGVTTYFMAARNGANSQKEAEKSGRLS